jgi:hypothetical protein
MVDQSSFALREDSHMSIQNESTAPELVWGAAAISRTIGRSEKSTFAALEAGKIPGAKKIAGRWGFNPRVFFATFEAA